MDKDALLSSNLVGIKARDPATKEPICALFDATAGTCVGSVAPDWFNAVRATSIVHKHIEQTLRSLDGLSVVLENAGMSDIAATVDTIAAGLAIGQRVAIVGIEQLVPGTKG